MNILYVGQQSPTTTSFHRFKALERLGHDVTIINPETVLGSNFMRKFHYKTGYVLLQRQVLNFLRHQLSRHTKPYQLIWINSGELLGARCVRYLRSFNCPIILYNNDDPTGDRDGLRFASLRRAIRYYDHIAVRVEKDLSELASYGARNVIQVFMSYDEVAHEPYQNTDTIPEEYRSDVAFIGTWIRPERRDKLIHQLVLQGIRVSIWGNRWSKSPLWPHIKHCVRGKALSGIDYVAAVQGAEICLGLLSKGNRDLHTRRSVEIPYIGSVLCAQRTAIHSQMYKEDIEAVFWDSADECIAKCKTLLADNQKRNSIKEQGMRKVRALQVGNEQVCDQIIKQVFAITK